MLVGFSISVRKMHQCLEGIVSSCEGGGVTLLPLRVAVASDMTGALVTPMIGITRGGGDVEVVINGCVGGTT